MMLKNIDNKLIPLAKRYSDALVAVAQSQGETEEVYNDLNMVSDSLSSVKQMGNFLSHPVIPLSEKKDMVNSVFKNRVRQSTFNLLNILLEKNKIDLVSTIFYCYEESLDRAKNILKVDVVSAVEIDEDLKQKLKEKLENKLQKAVKFEYELKPEIIAGLVLNIQDKVIDGSMASKLESFKKTLK